MLECVSRFVSTKIVPASIHYYMGGFATWLLGREAEARSLAKTPPIPPTAVLNTEDDASLDNPPAVLNTSGGACR